MILTAHQPVYLPWLGFFHKIILSDKYVFLNNVQYSKNDWINRNKIKTCNGEIYLTVPVYKSKKKICDIEIDNSVNWRKKHWNSIQQAYSKSKFFKNYSSFFEDLYQKEWIKLHELNEYIINWVLHELEIDTKLYSGEFLNLKKSKNDLIIEICEKLKSKKFIFGKLGVNYADNKVFKEKGIQIYFQEYLTPIYNQCFGKFIPNLSIVDLLFNCGPGSKDVILKDNITKV